jgi:hypothetical protein
MIAIAQADDRHSSQKMIASWLKTVTMNCNNQRFRARWA